VTAKFLRLSALAGVVLAAGALAACGEFVRDGHSPARLVIIALEGQSGPEGEPSGTLLSDVITFGSPINDPGHVELGLQLRDIGNPTSPNAPSGLNAVTINRYHVKYVRADGRNIQGVDVPYEFDSAITVTVPADGTAEAGFDLVRHLAKLEAPLAALAFDRTLIATIAVVTFYGRDQAGNTVSVEGQIGVTFGNFADPID